MSKNILKRLQQFTSAKHWGPDIGETPRSIRAKRRISSIGHENDVNSTAQTPKRRKKKITYSEMKKKMLNDEDTSKYTLNTPTESPRKYSKKLSYTARKRRVLGTRNSKKRENKTKSFTKEKLPEEIKKSLFIEKENENVNKVNLLVEFEKVELEKKCEEDEESVVSEDSLTRRAEVEINSLEKIVEKEIDELAISFAEKFQNKELALLAQKHFKKTQHELLGFLENWNDKKEIDQKTIRAENMKSEQDSYNLKKLEAKLELKKLKVEREREEFLRRCRFQMFS
eukprot:maker-scaffold_37-snap-gene-2.4-mRNA-1 protein AED:0.00 eAED:0.00 QI:16/1/1/1/1/1/2/100/283